MVNTCTIVSDILNDNFSHYYFLYIIFEILGLVSRFHVKLSLAAIDTADCVEFGL
jgi:hypothetical protein